MFLDKKTYKHTHLSSPPPVSSTPTFDINRQRTTHKQRYHPRRLVRSSFVPSYSFRPTTVGYYFIGIIYWFYFIFTTRQPRRRCISVFSASITRPSVSLRVCAVERGDAVPTRSSFIRGRHRRPDRGRADGRRHVVRRPRRRPPGRARRPGRLRVHDPVTGTSGSAARHHRRQR